MPEVERARALLPGVLVRHAERIRPRPRLERLVALPDRVRGVQDVVLAIRPAQQVELDEARHRLQVAVARGPHVLEILLGALGDHEAVHGNEHCDLSLSLHIGCR